MRKLPCEFLPCESNQVCGGDHGDVIQDEGPQMLIWSREVESNGRRYERPEGIGNHGQMACGPKTYPCEVPWVYPGSATLTIRLDPLRNLVAIVIEYGRMLVVFGFLAVNVSRI